MEYIIETSNLTKKFGNFTAVNNLDLKIKKGEIFGFLGPNGAGKSTTIRMLCGIMPPTQGTAKVVGYDIIREPEEIKQRIGYVTQQFGLYEDLSIYENLNFYASLYNMPKDRVEHNVADMLKLLQLDKRKDTLVGNLSGGLKQRVSLGCAVVHEPELIFLDEPTAGVDPIFRREIWDTMKGLSQQGVTLFITTHYLEEASRCTYAGFIFDGALVALDTVDNLTKGNRSLEDVYISLIKK